MLWQKELKKNNKKELIFLILRLHLLIALLIAVLWSRRLLKKKPLKSAPDKIFERKASFLPPDMKKLEEPVAE